MDLPRDPGPLGQCRRPCRLFFDYLFPLLLILSVVRQVRGRRLGWFQLAWPLALAGWAAVKYLHGFPATGGSLLLVITCAGTGALLGLLAGVYTRIHPGPDGTLIARATSATVALWVLGTAGRLVFGLYAGHGGGPVIASFSAAHGISVRAWGAALILMALSEVLGRTVVLGLRALRSGGGAMGRLGSQVRVLTGSTRPGGGDR